MVDYIVNENGVERQATDVEKAEIDARNKAWTDDAPNRKLKQVKEIRLEKLIKALAKFCVKRVELYPN